MQVGTEAYKTWRSRVAGRARTIGNRVYPKRVSRVQIPPSPPKLSGILNGIPDISFYQITICFDPLMILLLIFDLNSTPANMVANIIYSMMEMLLFH